MLIPKQPIVHLAAFGTLDSILPTAEMYEALVWISER